LRGPVGRACNIPEDARLEDPAYSALGFRVSVKDGCDAGARSSVRLAEIRRSLELIHAARADHSASRSNAVGPSGTGSVSVETPRGRASLAVTIVDNHVVDVALEVPSSNHVHLVEHVSVGHELADALIGVASLDLSAWELDQ
jgi:Ni,Fe-hydrogenase III large subunit